MYSPQNPVSTDKKTKNKVSMCVYIHLMLTFNYISNCCKLLCRLFFSNFQLHRTLKTYKLTNQKTKIPLALLFFESGNCLSVEISMLTKKFQRNT